MLGKSVGARVLLVGLLVVGVIACAHNVPQDSATGNDGKQKGAKEIRLENNEGKTRGIVTYPGGDRIDWKVIEVPTGKRGVLDFKLQWTPPRPGLQLAFDVFDEWNTPLVSSSKKAGKRGRGGRSRTATLDNAKGKYFVRVYAVSRGDAGAYRLTVEFKETLVGPAFDPLKLEIPEPPKLAAIPDHVEPCDDLNFDPKKQECKSFCPASGAPPNWPPCAGKCPTPPDINIDACLNTMPCPNPPDRRVKKCPKSKWPKCPDIKNPDANNPNCDNAKADPVKGRILKPEVQGSEVIISIGKGENSGVAKGWRGEVLRGDSDSTLPGGEFTVIKVDKNISVGKVRLTIDQVTANPWVRLSPP
jgi:hypothetical protein